MLRGRGGDTPDLGPRKAAGSFIGEGQRLRTRNDINEGSGSDAQDDETGAAPTVVSRLRRRLVSLQNYPL